MKSLHILYIDDNQEAARRVKGQLTRKPSFRVDVFTPTDEKGITRCFKSKPDVILLDYRLERDGVVRSGPGFAARFTDEKYQGAIALISRKDILKPASLPFDDEPTFLGRGSFFDYAFFREKLSQAAGRREVLRKLASLAKGYQTITRLLKGRSRSTLTERILKASSSEARQASFCGFPNDSDDPRTIGLWVTTKLLRYPGLVLPLHYAAVRQGTTYPKSGKAPSGLRKAKYTGVFSEGWDVWWASRIGSSLQTQATTSTQLKCAFCGKTGADTVCGISKEHIHRSHGIEYQLDDWPTWASRFLVGFHVIEKGKADLDWDRFPPSAREILDELKDGD